MMAGKATELQCEAFVPMEGRTAPLQEISAEYWAVYRAKLLRQMEEAIGKTAVQEENTGKEKTCHEMS